MTDKGGALPLTIIMLMAGEGRRVQPPQSEPIFKPTIKVAGKRLFEWSLQAFPNTLDFETHLVLTQDQNTKFQVSNAIDQSLYKTCLLANSTSGPLETLYQALNRIKPKGPFVCLDCDLLFASDEFFTFAKNHQDQWDGALLYFKADKPIYSFLKKENDRVIEVKEKVAISDWGICGCYHFSSPQLVMDNYLEVIAKTKGEPYLSHLYQHLLEQGKKIKAIPVDHFESLGTLADLKRFEAKNPG